jgi:phosphoketolase
MAAMNQPRTGEVRRKTIYERVKKTEKNATTDRLELFDHPEDATTARVIDLGSSAAYAKQYLRDKLLDHKAYIDQHGEDMPDIRNWKWSNPK